MNSSLIYRCWQYFRQGYSLYLSLPIGILNFLTITYYLMMERLTFLKDLLPHFAWFMVLATLCLFPLATFLGWLHIKKSAAFTTESVMTTERNPITAHSQRVTMEMLFKIMEANKIPISNDERRLFEYWKRLEKSMEWKP